MYKYFLLVAFDGCEAGSLLVAMTSRRPSRESNQHSPDKKEVFQDRHSNEVKDTEQQLKIKRGTFQGLPDQAHFARYLTVLAEQLLHTIKTKKIFIHWILYLCVLVISDFLWSDEIISFLLMWGECLLRGNWSEAVHYMVHTTWVGDISISIWCCCGVCLCWGCPLHSAIADTL